MELGELLANVGAGYGLGLGQPFSSLHSVGGHVNVVMGLHVLLDFTHTHSSTTRDSKKHAGELLYGESALTTTSYASTRIKAALLLKPLHTHRNLLSRGAGTRGTAGSSMETDLLEYPEANRKKTRIRLIHCLHAWVGG